MKIRDYLAPSRWIPAIKSKAQALWHVIKAYMRPSAWIRALRGRSVLFYVCASVFTLCVTVLAVLNIMAAIQGKVQTATGFSEYSVVLEDGTDIVISGAVAQIDVKKKIKLHYTLSGNTFEQEIEHENGVFEARVRIGPGQMGDPVQAQLLVNDRVVDSMQASVRSYALSILDDRNASQTLKILVSDLLRYGYETQRYLGEVQAAEDLLRDVPLEEGTPYQTPVGAYKKEGDGEIDIKDILLIPTNMLALCFTTDARMEDGYDVDEDGCIYIWGIPVTSFFTPIEIGVYKGDVLASAKVTYSVADYVKWNANPDLDPLMHALYSYAMSAHIHFGCSFDLKQQGATCQAPGFLIKDCDCGLHEEEVIPVRDDMHQSIQVVYQEGTGVQYQCDACHHTWTSKQHGAWKNDGTNTEHLVGYDTNRFFTENGERLPVITDDGALAWTRQGDSDTTINDFQLTMSLLDASDPPLCKQENSQAFISFRIKKIGEQVIEHTLNAKDPLQVLLVEKDNGTPLWSADWCVQIPLLYVDDEGDLMGWNGVNLGPFTDRWQDVAIVLSFQDGIDEKTGDPIDCIHATYYVNGEGRGIGVTRCTTKNGGFNALHFSTHTRTEGNGIAIDDFIFAY